MQTKLIREMIGKAVLHEQKTGNTTQALIEAAAMRGKPATASEVGQTLGFIRGYIERVPELMEACASAATAVGIDSYANPILHAAQQYFLSPLDVIFDHLGLMGLMDDAYFAQRLLQSISEAYIGWTGRPLLPMNLAPANAAIRELIGDPQASQLDQAVEATLKQASIKQAFHGLTGYASTLPVDDSEWDDAAMAKLVDEAMESVGLKTPPPDFSTPLPGELRAELAEAAESPGEPEVAALELVRTMLLSLLGEMMEAGDLNDEQRAELVALLEELGELSKETEGDVPALDERVVRVQELTERMGTVLEGITEETESAAGSRAALVQRLLP
jgi:uncharacterized membrane protein YkvA (DUF1232 family)